LAAFYVMVGHARWLLWEGYGEGFLKHPESYTFAHKLLVYFFSLFKYGYEAVLFFFVLSGFVIHLRYARKLVANKTEAHFDGAASAWRRGC
jgi:peptidoglycan/LPS O-acetylase OafA/YrhL